MDFITIFYGSNDFTGGVTLDNSENSLDTTCYLGALRYSIERILEAYPRIRLLVLSPTYRTWRDENTDTDNKTINNKKVMDFVNGAISTATEYKVPSIDMYSTLGINRITENVFLKDGAHPTSIGIERIANTITAKLIEL